MKIVPRLGSFCLRVSTMSAGRDLDSEIGFSTESWWVVLDFGKCSLLCCFISEFYAKIESTENLW